MESPTSDTNIYHQTLHTMSTSKTSVIRSSTREDSEVYPIDNKIVSSFRRYYFSGSKIPQECLQNILEIWDENVAQIIVDDVLQSSIVKRFPVRSTFTRNLLKQLMTELENRCIEVPDDFYGVLAAAMSDANADSHRIYLTAISHTLLCCGTGLNLDNLENDDDVLVIVRESNTQLCHGTTGLSVWQASCDLANLLCKTETLEGKRVLELGAGCGLTGLALASTGATLVILSDYDERVLRQLEENVKLNNLQSVGVSVESLNWLDFDEKSINNKYDLVVAADVVYDKAILPALCSVLAAALSIEGSKAVIACTLRDPETLAAFVRQIESAGLTVQSVCRTAGNVLTHLSYHPGEWPPYANCEVLKKTKMDTQFPFHSTLLTPTITYEIVKPKQKTTV